MTGGNRFGNGGGGNRFGNGGGGNRYGNGGGGHGGGYELRGVSAKETLFEVLHVVFKRKMMILLIFFAIATPSIAGVVARQAKYVASAKVNSASDRAAMTIQPTDVTALSTVKLNQSMGCTARVRCISPSGLPIRVRLKMDGLFSSLSTQTTMRKPATVSDLTYWCAVLNSPIPRTSICERP